MTIQLFRTKKEAEKEVEEMKEIIFKCRFKPIKIRFDQADRTKYGMRGFDFTAKHGNMYYLIAESKAEVKSWGLKSKVM